MTFDSISDRDEGHLVVLDSYPGQKLFLNDSVQIPLPVDSVPRSTDRGLIVNALTQSLLNRLDSIHDDDKTLLLLLPDKTRLANAANIAVDSILSLVYSERYNLDVTIAYGLGSHPLMTNDQIRGLLSDVRWQRIIDSKISILQHSTKSPLPSKAIEIDDLDLGLPTNECATLSLSIPHIFCENHIIVVAGDTDLHPYEKRCGSGGLNKMLVIGFGNSTVIDRTHSPAVLSDADNSGQRSNPIFVRLLDHYSAKIRDYLLVAENSKLVSRPIGFSVIKLSGDDEPCDYWIGENDEERQNLTLQVLQDRRCYMERSVNHVICDGEACKATDILAGARTLHSLCAQNHSNNHLICSKSTLRMALLFNPCVEELNNGGVGNSGTLRHLNVLAGLVRSNTSRISSSLRLLSNTEDLFKFFLDTRAEILRQWSLHFERVSNPRSFLQEIRSLVTVVGSKSPKLDGLTGSIDSHVIELEHWADAVSLPFHMLIEIGLLEDDIKACKLLVETLCMNDLNNFSEGGQRAMRLLKILQNFEQLVLLTDNENVLSYIAELSPDLSSVLPSAIRTKFRSSFDALGFSLLGISCLDLRAYSPQKAVDFCLMAHQSMLPSNRQVTAAFFRKPGIFEAKAC
jgi:hypothetical protein